MKRLCASITLLAAAAAASAAPVQWTAASGGNDHWYEFIDSNVTWQQAFAGAQAASFLGMTGYLATLTSAGENRFASVTAAGGILAWIGGSDDGNEGIFSWRDGPEAGQVFSYTNWFVGEPNNCCTGENFVHTNWTNAMEWNDHGGPGNANQVNGYLIEYGAASITVPEPASMLLGLLALGAATAARKRRRAG